ncbi:MAG: hypothetical protein KDA61_06155 [Planctomycetales bacterium]|nr:hypothetical protein [Planctomycetales bacterium]
MNLAWLNEGVAKEVVRGIALVVGVSLAWATPAAYGDFDIVVPAYFYPTNNGPWDDLADAAGSAPITAIMNPASGPGTQQDANYVTAVNALRAAGGRVIAYVHTSYGARDLATVLQEIDRYDAFYEIDGIFLDEMANTGPAERLDYYRSIYDYVKGIDPLWEVMGNPGTNTLQQYLTWPAADRLVVYEREGSFYPGHAEDAWNHDYDRSHFVNLVHTEGATALADDLTLAKARNVGGIYITDDVMNNPWDRLPSYWTSEVAAVAQLNASYLEGDFNVDGLVDGDDLERWNAFFGRSTNAWHVEGDAQRDGDVDGGDFLIWQRQRGSVAPGSAVSGSVFSVPEPTTSLAATAASLFGAAFRRDRKRMTQR